MPNILNQDITQTHPEVTILDNLLPLKITQSYPHKTPNIDQYHHESDQISLTYSYWKYLIDLTYIDNLSNPHSYYSPVLIIINISSFKRIINPLPINRIVN